MCGVMQRRPKQKRKQAYTGMVVDTCPASAMSTRTRKKIGGPWLLDGPRDDEMGAMGPQLAVKMLDEPTAEGATGFGGASLFSDCFLTALIGRWILVSISWFCLAVVCGSN